ncbi:MAG TPA: undecaprenyl-diphosphatase UppP [Anaerolinea thermolimosa]|uniref:Undecaprenyl-diphosphatase n=1 Tax=Anaerolinea thermolimosa TaxID=229919 RepID=A0A3D1JED9_9CHLR|nr:undecaprenyl-diphosphatase UppP [Anaerolinea thermolimosa]GAP07181.1 undecaprenyl-diphosphatase [Anaerolinea thermolimosa]HCE16585.1 undecaprenyl-diphosphatase UppP [Anaerolinea thermolimosa]
MSLLQAILLGIIQGLTEFLPISSSAHLVIAPFLLNWQLDPQITFTFDVLVQNGTLVAVVIYFWKDLWAILRAFVLGLIHRQPFTDPDSRLGWFILLASLPAGILGISIKPLVEAAFNSILATGLFLGVTAVLLLVAEWLGRRNRPLESIRWLDALVMGFFQALAIFPGISRSGATISGGMLCNLNRRAAARFSFLMSVPIMLAAGGLETLDALKVPGSTHFLLPILAGFIAAAITGYLAIHWLLGYLQKHPLRWFAIYCLVAGGLTIAVYFLRG